MNPWHSPLERILLEAGADPNDDQALYNRMFEPDDDHLELLLELGADPGLCDRTYGVTPLGWAERAGHADHDELIALLR